MTSSFVSGLLVCPKTEAAKIAARLQAASAESPVTNEGVIQGDEIGDIDYQGNCLPCDSLFTLRWKPVAGAARYMLHVYQLTPGASDDDNLRSGAAAPI